MPQLTAATCAVSGSLLIVPAFSSPLTASRSATQPPVIDGAARAAVGLQHVAVDGDLPLAERHPVDAGAQAAADQPLDLLGAARLLAGRGLAAGAGGGRARQHAVFRRHPAEPGLAQERRHRLLDAGGAEHVGVAHADQAGALGVAADAGLDADGAQRVGGAAGGAHAFSPSGSARAAS